MIQTKKFAIWS